MIDSSLSYLCYNANEYLTKKYELSERIISLSNIVNPDGSVALQDQNQIVMTLVNLTEESVLKNVQPMRSSGEFGVKLNPTLNLNSYVLFSAFYTGVNYHTGLKMISDIISYYQSNRLFVKQNAPGMPANINKLTMEFVSLSLDQMSHLWSCMGSKYMPSVLYKVGVLPFTDEEIKDIRPKISGVDNKIKPT